MSRFSDIWEHGITDHKVTRKFCLMMGCQRLAAWSGTVKHHPDDDYAEYWYTCDHHKPEFEASNPGASWHRWRTDER